MAQRSAYRRAMVLARGNMGRIDIAVAQEITKALNTYVDQLEANLTKMVRAGVGAGPLGRYNLRRAKPIFQSAARQLERTMLSAVAEGRMVSFNETLRIWENTSMQIAKRLGVQGAMLGALRNPPIIMLGAFESLGAPATWQTLLKGHAGRAAAEAGHIMRMGMLEGIGADEMAKRMRPYVQGSQPFKAMFERVPTPTGQYKRLDLRKVPRELRGAANKMKFNAERIAFSEMHNARHEAEVQHMHADPLVKGVKWSLSPVRSTGFFKPPDQCDVIAANDFYGLGKGVYPTAKVPSPPHPFDRCELEPVQVQKPLEKKDQPDRILNPLQAYIPKGPGGRTLTPKQALRIRQYTATSLHEGELGYRLGLKQRGYARWFGSSNERALWRRIANLQGLAESRADLRARAKLFRMATGIEDVDEFIATAPRPDTLEKMRLALAHRQEGLSYAKIGERMGISPMRARGLCIEGEQLGLLPGAPVTPLVPPVPPVPVAPPPAVPVKQVAKQVIKGLKPKDEELLRKALALRERGYSYKQIGEELGRSPMGARSLVLRAEKFGLKGDVATAVKPMPVEPPVTTKPVAPKAAKVRTPLQSKDVRWADDFVESTANQITYADGVSAEMRLVEQATEAFGEAPEELLQAIAKKGKPRGYEYIKDPYGKSIVTKEEGSYYQRWSRWVQVQRYGTSNQMERRVFGTLRHEYGHHFDRVLNPTTDATGKYFSSSGSWNKEFKALQKRIQRPPKNASIQTRMAAYDRHQQVNALYREYLAEVNKQNQAGIKALEKVRQDFDDWIMQPERRTAIRAARDRSPAAGDAKLAEFKRIWGYDEKVKVAEAYLDDLQVSINYFDDWIGSITWDNKFNRMGNGHSISYYKQVPKSRPQAETFANMTEAYATKGRSINWQYMQKIAPELCDEYEAAVWRAAGKAYQDIAVAEGRTLPRLLTEAKAARKQAVSALKGDTPEQTGILRLEKAAQGKAEIQYSKVGPKTLKGGLERHYSTNSWLKYDVGRDEVVRLISDPGYYQTTQIPVSQIYRLENYSIIRTPSGVRVDRVRAFIEKTHKWVGPEAQGQWGVSDDLIVVLRVTDDEYIVVQGHEQIVARRLMGQYTKRDLATARVVDMRESWHAFSGAAPTADIAPTPVRVGKAVVRKVRTPREAITADVRAGPTAQGRKALELRQQGKSYKQIADELGMSPMGARGLVLRTEKQLGAKATQAFAKAGEVEVTLPSKVAEALGLDDTARMPYLRRVVEKVGKGERYRITGTPEQMQQLVAELEQYGIADTGFYGQSIGNIPASTRALIRKEAAKVKKLVAAPAEPPPPVVEITAAEAEVTPEAAARAVREIRLKGEAASAGVNARMVATELGIDEKLAAKLLAKAEKQGYLTSNVQRVVIKRAGTKGVQQAKIPTKFYGMGQTQREALERAEAALLRKGKAVIPKPVPAKPPPAPGLPSTLPTALPEQVAAVDTYMEGFATRNPQFQKLLDKAKVRLGPERGTAVASQQGDGVLLRPKFLEHLYKDGVQAADDIVSHELGHFASSTLQWEARAEQLGISLWDDLPLGAPNYEEAFADVFAVIARNDERGLALLREKWPNWLKLMDELDEVPKPLSAPPPVPVEPPPVPAAKPPAGIKPEWARAKALRDEGKTYKQVAEEMNVSPMTARSYALKADKAVGKVPVQTRAAGAAAKRAEAVDAARKTYKRAVEFVQREGRAFRGGGEVKGGTYAKQLEAELRKLGFDAKVEHQYSSIYSIEYELKPEALKAAKAALRQPTKTRLVPNKRGDYSIIAERKYVPPESKVTTNLSEEFNLNQVQGGKRPVKIRRKVYNETKGISEYKTIPAEVPKVAIDKRAATVAKQFAKDFEVSVDDVVVVFDEEAWLDVYMENTALTRTEALARLRSSGPPPAFANEGKVFIGPDISYNMAWEGASPQAYRVVAHELMHTASSSRGGAVRGLDAILEEGANEVLTMNWFRQRAASYVADWEWRGGLDEATQVYTKLRGAQAMLQNHAYSDFTAEVILQSARRVGWNRQLILDDIANVFTKGTDLEREAFFYAHISDARFTSDTASLLVEEGRLVRMSHELDSYGLTTMKREAQAAGVDFDAVPVDPHWNPSAEWKKDAFVTATALLRWLYGV